MMTESTKAYAGGPCIFCSIAGGKVPSKRVYEDKDSVAFLDIYPRSRGMTIVVPKEHFDDMHDNLVAALKSFQTAEVVARMLKQALGAKFVEMGIMRSEGVSHFHIKLYPVYADEKPLFEGAPIDMREPDLDELARAISAVRVEPAAAEHQREEEVQRKYSEEEERFIRNSLDEA